MQCSLWKTTQKTGISNQAEWETAVDAFVDSSKLYSIGASSIGQKAQHEHHTCCICDLLKNAIPEYKPKNLKAFIKEDTEKKIR